MVLRATACSCLIFSAALSAPGPDAAECVILPAAVMAKQVMEDKLYELVFTGNVVAVTRTADLGYRATFDVDRVWKGVVTKQSDLYVWELSAEHPDFRVGHHYLALAQTLVSARARDSAGVPSSVAVAFTPVNCSDALDPDVVRYLGPGQPPKR